MAEINIRINDQDYKIACADGQEQHLASLASYLDSKIRELITRVGQVGESRLLVMACLLITDELLESKKANLEQKKEAKSDIQDSQSDGLSIVEFEKTVLNFSNLTTKSIIEPKIQETSTLKIFYCMTNINIESKHNCSQDKKSLMDNKIEFNKRFGMPIYIPLISLICSALLASRRDKKIYSYNKYIYFFLCFIMLTLSEILVRYSGLSWNYTIIYYSLPVILLPFLYFSLIRKFKYENLN